jgi:hypothetical protein
MMHPFAEGNVAAAQQSIEKVLESLRASIAAKSESGTWALIGQALGYAASAKAQLEDAMQLEEMAVTAGEEAE